MGKYRIVKRIGQGSYGRVYLIDKLDGKSFGEVAADAPCPQYCMKEILLKSDPKARQQAISEVIPDHPWMTLGVTLGVTLESSLL